jgi:predicted acyltransferase (DUF342 family)
MVEMEKRSLCGEVSSWVSGRQLAGVTRLDAWRDVTQNVNQYKGKGWNAGAGETVLIREQRELK